MIIYIHRKPQGPFKECVKKDWHRAVCNFMILVTQKRENALTEKRGKFRCHETFPRDVNTFLYVHPK